MLNTASAWEIALVASSNSLSGIQLIRGAAATMVMIFHVGLFLEVKTGTDITRLTQAGAAGVDLFFVVSGFIMIYTTAQRDFSASDFLYRRVVRIVPLYWLMTLVFVIGHLAAPSGLSNYQFSSFNFVAALAFVPSYNFRNEIFPPLAQGWTLVYEMFFYLVLALVSVIAFGMRVWLLVASFVVMIALGLGISTRNALLLTYTNPILLEFVLGCIIADLVVRDRLHFGRYFSVALIIIGAAALLVGTKLFQDVPRFRVLFWGIPSFLIVLGTVQAEQFFELGAWRTGTMIGDSSYSLYLCHTFALSALGFIFKFRLGHMWGGLPFVPVMVVACLVAGLLFWRYIERPLTGCLRPRQSVPVATRCPAKASPAQPPTPIDFQS